MVEAKLALSRTDDGGYISRLGIDLPKKREPVPKLGIDTLSKGKRTPKLGYRHTLEG